MSAGCAGAKMSGEREIGEAEGGAKMEARDPSERT